MKNISGESIDIYLILTNVDGLYMTLMSNCDKSVMLFFTATTNW